MKMIEPTWGLIVAGVLGVIGTFYRHGTVLAVVQQHQIDQDKGIGKLWDKLDAMDKKLTDIQIKVGRGNNDHGKI